MRQDTGTPHDDPRTVPVTSRDLRDELESIPVRQSHVEHDDVPAIRIELGTCLGQRLGRHQMSCADALVGAPREHRLKKDPVGCLIFHEQNAQARSLARSQYVMAALVFCGIACPRGTCPAIRQPLVV